jgi:hypothetical protein
VTPGSRSLQVDLFFSIASKGPEYLSADAILHAARQHQSDGLQFLVPSPAHEAIVSLCAHLVYGGFLKEKYFSKVQRTFVSDRFEVLAALQPAFGIKAGTRLLDAVTEGDRRKILDCIRPLRLALNLRCLLRKPLRGTMATARYYASIFKLRYSPRNLETVCFVGPDCYDKMAIIDRLTPMLHSAAKVVNKCQFRSQLPFAQKTTEFNSSTGPQAGTSWSSLSSVIKVAQWLLEGWKIQLFGRRELTLRIFERFYHDLLIEPKSYGYSGPMWFARFVGRLFPSPDLWILLDPAGGGSQSRNGEVISTERPGKGMSFSTQARQSPTSPKKRMLL